MNWGTVGEREKRMGREGGKGGQFTSNLGPEWTGIAPRTKEGVQVSKRGSGTGEGLSRQRGITKRISKGIVPRASDIMPTLYISCNCVCVVLIMNCNKPCIRDARYVRLISWNLQSGSKHPLLSENFPVSDCLHVMVRVIRFFPTCYVPLGFDECQERIFFSLVTH